MQNHPVSVTKSGGRRYLRAGGIFILTACAIFAMNACERAPETVTVTVKDGVFSPNPVNIKPGDTIRWEILSRTDSIVQISNPYLNLYSDPCGITDNGLAHAFAPADPNEFTGPSRKGVSGIFALGSNEPGFVQKPDSELCNCESPKKNSCSPLTVDSRDGNTYKLCPNEGAILQTLDATWDNPDITGVTLRAHWSDIQIDQTDPLTGKARIVYRWDDLDREMNKAVEKGKLFTLDIRAGEHGTPDWIFADYDGAAGPGPVTRLTFKDWGSEATPPNGNCGREFPLGSPMHVNYRDLYVAMINELALHVASDSRWFQSLAHVKMSGANLFSSEARLPKRCYDGDDAGEGKGVLDIIEGDPCLCNSKIWAVEGNYTPEGLYTYYRVVGNTIYNAFHQRKSMGYQLIQAGFPRVVDANNFEGDTLVDDKGNYLLNEYAVTSDDLGPNDQTVMILEEGRNGRFVDPYGATIDHKSGKLFVPQHSGLGRLPEDDNLAGCSQAVAIDPVAKKAIFPISQGTKPDANPGCPNQWAVRQATLHSQITGFQTNNAKEVGSPASVESALWNLTLNSNGVFLELYEERLWEIYHSRGTGDTALVLDQNRENLNNPPALPLPPLAVLNPAPYSKTLFAWSEDLHERRRMLVNTKNPHLLDPFPATHEHTFSKVITVPETYYYINPSKCSVGGDLSRVGQIIVTP